jgi:uncharacterized repeat protein (TIGR01451 family)
MGRILLPESAPKIIMQKTSLIKKAFSVAASAALVSSSYFSLLPGLVNPVSAGNAKLELTNSVDKDPVNRGEVLTYSITVKNAGSVDLTNVIVWINTPNLANYLPGSSTYTGHPNGKTLSLTDAWVGDHVNFGTIPTGKWIVLKYQTKVANNANNGDLVWSVANADSEQTNRVQANASSVVFLANPGLCAKKTADKSEVKPGDTVTYTITICNSGNVVLNNVRLFDEIPSQVTYVAGSTRYTRGTFSTAVTDAWVNDGVNLGDLSSENDGIFTFKVKVKDNVADGTIIRNAAKLKSDQTPTWIECDNKITVQSKQVKEKGSLKIFKFNDYDGNGIFAGADKAAGGFTFRVVGPGYDKTVTVDANGVWNSGQIESGEYTITEQDKAGWTHTTSKTVTVKVVGGQTTEVRFGNYLLRKLRSKI